MTTVAPDASTSWRSSSVQRFSTAFQMSVLRMRFFRTNMGKAPFSDLEVETAPHEARVRLVVEAEELRRTVRHFRLFARRAEEPHPHYRAAEVRDVDRAIEDRLVERVELRERERRRQ